MRFSKELVALAVLASVVTVPFAARADITTDTVRQRAEQACYDDVNRLCNDAIPNEDKITACMTVHRKELSPKCRDIFDGYGK